jgi:hypothetical protein
MSHVSRNVAFIWDITLYILVEVVEFPKEPTALICRVDVPQSIAYTYSRLRGFTSQKAALFIVTTQKTADIASSKQLRGAM